MGEKTVKYEYEYGLCKRMHYRGLWCVRYEGEPGHFEKAGMACSCAVDGCDKDCAVLESADAVIDRSGMAHDRYAAKQIICLETTVHICCN